MQDSVRMGADFFAFAAPRSFDFANVSLYYEYLRSMGLSSSGAGTDQIQKMLYVLNQEESFAI
jgi:hypothetical protein